MALEVAGPIAAILGMIAVTQIWRLGGFWLMGRVPLTRRVERGLSALPGSVVIATILPLTVKGGLAAALAIATVLLVRIVTGRELLALLAALAAAAGCRAMGW